MNVILSTTLILGIIAFVSGVLLYTASRVFAVEEDPMAGEIAAILPGANCGACGVPGCQAFAEKLAATRDSEMYCPVGGPDLAAELAETLGIQLVAKEKMVARVLCQGGDNARRTGEYFGVASCNAVSVIHKESLNCPYGCLGYGDCVLSCDFDAIHMVNGVALIDEEKCTACGACVPECPVGIITMQPYRNSVFVACKSTDPGGAVRKYCSVGCTGCKKCVKACTHDAILFDNFLAKIVPDQCVNCFECVGECDTETIVITQHGIDVFREKVLPHDKAYV